MELKNKIISFLGDSITEGVGVENIEENRYDNVIKNKLNLKATYNYGISGTKIAHQTEPRALPREDLCFCGRAYDMCPDSDVIIVFGGTNDYGVGDACFGDMNDSTPKTYCGAVEFLMKTLKELYPKSKIVFLTPARRKGDEFLSTEVIKTMDSKPLKYYGDVIKEKAQKYNISVIDTYNELKINPNIEKDRVKYAPDGLHFNDEGQKKLAELIISHLKNY